MKLLFLLVGVLMPLTGFTQDFSALDQLLKANVVVSDLDGGGLQTAFDYKKAHKNPETKKLIQSQKSILAKYDIKKMTQKNQAIAFWINAYNFFMLTTILEKGFESGQLVINSVKDRHDHFGSFLNRYKVFQREVNVIGGKKYSLDQMEKGQLLSKAFKAKSWKDARVHFVVNCASVGCPPLSNKIYTANTLDVDLTKATRKALKTERHFKFHKKYLYLTQLFEWYKDDFNEAEGSVKTFLKKYTDKKIHAQIDASEIKFIDYDWKLNRPKNFK